jgi:hypothetical protein
MVVNLNDIDCILAEEALSCLRSKDIYLYMFSILLLLGLLHLFVQYAHQLLLVLLLAKLDVAVPILVD